jgi:exodeoxyribonuclease VII large subunit
MLPWLPEVIGVVTSPTGAVIRDILHRLADRFPRRVLVWPVRVQGEGSAEQIAAAIRGFNALPEGGRIPRPDLLIVARGGGSLEDLWSFNEEIVVRAAADSMIPLISAVGHETDITLIDFAADKRAPTPTAAAEMAVPVRSELLVEVTGLARRTMVCWQRGQEARRNELRAAVRALPGSSELLAIPRQRLDGAASALPRGLKANTHAHFRRFAGRQRRLTMRVLRGQVVQATASADRIRRTDAQFRKIAAAHRRDRFAGLEIRLKASNSPTRRRSATRSRATANARCGWPSARGARSRHPAAIPGAGRPQRPIAGALSYRGVLARGFALVRDEQGLAVHAAAGVGPGARLTSNLPMDTSARPRMPTGRRQRSVPAKPARQSQPVSEASRRPRDTQARGQSRSSREACSRAAYRASHSATRFCESARASASVPTMAAFGHGGIGRAGNRACSGKLARSKS